jgi:hypothetical protein
MTLSSWDGQFHIGDTVKPNLKDGKELTPFVMKDSYTDGFGSVLLSNSGGKGFGSEYCETVS